MKATELINKLHELVEEYGKDPEVILTTSESNPGQPPKPGFRVCKIWHVGWNHNKVFIDLKDIE